MTPDEKQLTSAALTETADIERQFTEFPLWLIRQRRRDDPIGDLARDAIRSQKRRDPYFRFPKSGTSEEAFDRHLAHNYACAEARQALHEAFSKYKKRPRSRAPISLKTRFSVFNRDGFSCVYCGRGPSETKLEVDHRVSVKDGGSNRQGNLVTSCFECNRGKGGKSL